MSSVISGYICWANMKENVFLFIPNLIGKYLKVFTFSLRCFRELLLSSRTLNDSWPPNQNNFQRGILLNSVLASMASARFYLRSLLKGASYFTGYARIVLAILSFYFMPTDYIMAAIMYLLSGLLDAFDGHAARYFGQSKLA